MRRSTAACLEFGLRISLSSISFASSISLLLTLDSADI